MADVHCAYRMAAARDGFNPPAGLFHGLAEALPNQVMRSGRAVEVR